MSLKLHKVAGVDARGRDINGKAVPGLPAGPNFLAAAFATPEGQQSPLGETAGNGHFLLRVDKVTLAGVEATLRLYRDGTQAVTDIPTLRMLAAPPSELEARAQEMVAALAAVGVQAVVRPGQGAVGGGTYPGATLAGATVVLGPGAGGADGLAGRLRTGDPPVIVRILDDCVVIDPRTVLPGQEEDLTRRVAEASRPSPEGQ